MINATALKSTPYGAIVKIDTPDRSTRSTIDILVDSINTFYLQSDALQNYRIDMHPKVSNKSGTPGGMEYLVALKENGRDAGSIKIIPGTRTPISTARSSDYPETFSSHTISTFFVSFYPRPEEQRKLHRDIFLSYIGKGRQ